MTCIWKHRLENVGHFVSASIQNTTLKAQYQENIKTTDDHQTNDE